VDKGFVFVSTNYRLLPGVDMATIVRDVAKSVRCVHDHVAEHGATRDVYSIWAIPPAPNSPRWSAPTTAT
jgi:acetyl esterase/lipase